MLRWGTLDIAETLDELVEPKSTALIMWDFATGLVSRAFNRDDFVRSAKNLVEAARDASVAVFYAVQNDVAWTDVGGALIRMRLKPITAEKIARVQSVNRPGTAEAEIVLDVAPAAGDVIFSKFMPSAFLGTDLEWRLRGRGIKSLVLAGISLETGIDGTAREAVHRGYYAIVARDAVSSANERRFRNSMAVVEDLHDVFDTSEIVASWSKASKKR
jgi:nicotinamidase-related amidase